MSEIRLFVPSVHIQTFDVDIEQYQRKTYKGDGGIVQEVEEIVVTYCTVIKKMV